MNNNMYRNVSNLIKKSVLRVKNQVDLDRKEGKLDTTVTIAGKQYDLMDIIIDATYENCRTPELSHQLTKEVKSDVEQCSAKIKSGIEGQMELMGSMLNNICNISDMRETTKLMHGTLDIMYDKTELGTTGVNIDKFISDTIAVTMYMIAGGDRHERCLTNISVLRLTCVLYILVKNGYVNEKVIDKRILEIMNVDSRLMNGCTFEEFTGWLSSCGVTEGLLEVYIELTAGDELEKSKLKLFYKLLNKEYTRSLTITLSKVELDNLRQKCLSDEEASKIVASLKRKGLNAVDMLVCFSLSNISHEIKSCMLADVCITYGVRRELCDKLIQNYINKMCSNIKNNAELLGNILNVKEAIIKRLLELGNKQSDEVIKQKEFIKRYKSQVKQLEKETKDIRQQLATQKNKNVKQVEYISNLKEKGLTDTKPLYEEIDKLKEDVTRAMELAELTKRDKNKTKTSLEQLRGQHTSLKEQLEEVKQDKLDKKANENERVNSIDLSCYINALRCKKIAVYGGDMMHAELNSLGIKNLKLIEASNRNISMSDLAYQDIIVIITGYMAHATLHIPKGAAEKFNIPIHYFNNKNVPMLIHEIFKAVYKEQDGNN